MKYLIIGTGGVGGTLAGFLSQAGRDVTCIARGEHKQAIRESGLNLTSDIKGNAVSSKVEVYDADEYCRLCERLSDDQKPDVIIVSVKGYSLDTITDVVHSASASKTVTIPVLNVFGTGDRLKELLGATPATVLDGCIYVVAFRTAPGHIRQSGRVLKVVMGTTADNSSLQSSMSDIANDMQEAGIKTIISEDIRLDTFMKWGFISAMSGAGLYHDCPMGEMQHPGEQRDTLTHLLEESYAIGKALDINLPDDYVAKNTDIIDHCTPDTTSSLQKDIANGCQSEIDGQIFSMQRLGQKLRLITPTYNTICRKFLTC